MLRRQNKSAAPLVAGLRAGQRGCRYSHGLHSYGHKVMAYMFLDYMVMAYTVMAYTVMAYIVMAYIAAPRHPISNRPEKMPI